ncbi:3'-phosphoadenosine 5'-phosphosulfate (PAPS) 3'-phosphatase [Synechococcus sp. PCC 7502]|uniref:3'(2'),5'-bisphosphate nucleotidase CysQ family protein n=1 Tax=Synechococcus sp. PCC 7502 TaxID=1173263 RepID=UPI00029FADFC|nr:inositol monophosphatase family protein [Synechococcus sp. PCC 7502]AFY72875.1 3'-phosphoadenosine 5'-phosphosulfate (PAPS) 3'-phosphatase [Synechococcus sp. PCC 7502]
MNPITEFDQVRAFIRQVGQKAKQLRQDKFEVIQKGHLDYVTTVDRTIDQICTAQFQAWFPDDGIITEENPDSMQIWQQDHDRLWLIDPIDGTDDFIAGGENYAVMVGLLEHNQPSMGWIYAPERDLMFYGGSAIGGLFTQTGDNYPIQLIPKTPPLRDRHRLLIGDKDQRKYGEEIQNLAPETEFYNMGGFGLKVMEVLMGNTELYFYLNRRVKLWDTVAPMAMAKFASVTVCDLDGAVIQYQPDVIDPVNLAHQQDVVVGWSQYVDLYLPKLVQVLAKFK